jgi:hypothetical protein
MVRIRRPFSANHQVALPEIENSLFDLFRAGQEQISSPQMPQLIWRTPNFPLEPAPRVLLPVKPDHSPHRNIPVDISFALMVNVFNRVPVRLISPFCKNLQNLVFKTFAPTRLKPTQDDQQSSSADVRQHFLGNAPSFRQNLVRRRAYVHAGKIAWRFFLVNKLFAT